MSNINIDPGYADHSHSISTNNTNLNQYVPHTVDNLYQYVGQTYNPCYTCQHCGMMYYGTHYCSVISSYSAATWDPQKEQMRQELAEIKDLLQKLLAPQLNDSDEEVRGRDSGGSGDQGAAEEGSIEDCPDLTCWPPRKGHHI